jgi:hypothetical protein
MSKAIVFSCIAAAIAFGLSISGAVGQERDGTSSPAAAPASAPPATARADAIVPPIRRVRPKTPPGPVGVAKAKSAARSKVSAVARGGPGSNVVAGAVCARGATFKRRLDRCDRKPRATTAAGQNGAAPPKNLTERQTR